MSGVRMSAVASVIFIHSLYLRRRVTSFATRIRFQSAETLERAILYLGATEEQIAGHRSALRQTGQGSNHVQLLLNRKNLLKIG
jgi:hypothetical protein